MQDQQLIFRLQQQDQGAISALYDAYSGALYGVVLRIVQTPELAQQVLQDTFLKAWRYGAQYDETKGRLFTWLLNIARNTAIDATRSAHFKNAKRTSNLDQVVAQAGNDTINPDHVGIREVVAKMDEKYRSLIEMIYFKGYTQEEVAEESGIPLGTVKTRIRYAINELRTIFGDNKVAIFFLASLSRFI
jgi:RNA polymerase sigma-70 factor (ECF subfamily)